MKKLTPEVYKTLKSEIFNEEVPNLFHRMLFKQSATICRQQKKNTVLSAQTNLFNLFFRQYNTILVISRKVAHIEHPDAHYLDVTSVQVLIRCCHERFLALWYLTSLGILPNSSHAEEAEFKWLCFYHSGLVESIQNMKLRSKLVDTSNLESIAISEKSKRDETFLKIKYHPIFAQLENDIKVKIEKYGAWRVVGQKLLSWSEFGRVSPLNSAMAQYEYHTMSMYTHPGYAGLIADIQHDGNIDGLLVYLYVLAASHINMMDEILPESSENFTTRELACLTEFLEIAKSWLQLPPLPEWDV